MVLFVFEDIDLMRLEIYGIKKYGGLKWFRWMILNEKMNCNAITGSVWVMNIVRNC
jgi:hypothetical protein